MAEEQAVFEQLTLSDFKKWRSMALKVHSQVQAFKEIFNTCVAKCTGRCC